LTLLVKIIFLPSIVIEEVKGGFVREGDDKDDDKDDEVTSLDTEVVVGGGTVGVGTRARDSDDIFFLQFGFFIEQNNSFSISS
jgi:hypothetical protein